MSATEARRAAIRALLRRRTVATQEELRSLLARAGHDVTQATLSRDLAHLGARRAHRATGGTTYELPEIAVADPLAEVGRLITAIEHNGVLVVIHSLPGAASAIAVALDHARLPDVIGTIAGDDTIFIAPARGATAARVATTLRKRISLAQTTITFSTTEVSL